MAAGMHDTGILGRIGQPGVFPDGKGIHIRPERHHGAGFTALDGGRHSVMALAPYRIQAQFLQNAKNLFRSVLFLRADFRVFMEPPAPFHTFCFQSIFRHMQYVH